MPRKICLIGLGKHGLLQLSKLLSKPDKWSVVSVADRSVAAYARFQYLHRDRGIPFYRTAPDALESVDVDVVVVSTTAPSHVSISENVIASGFSEHLLVEKPISNSLGEARRLAGMIADTGWQGVVRVNFNRRCSELYSRVYELVHSGELGQLVQAVYRVPCKISMTGSHYIDLINWFMGSEPSRVSARLDKFSRVDDRGSSFFDPGGLVQVWYKNGSTFTFDATNTDEGLPQGMTLRCERGEIFVDVSESAARINGPQGQQEIPSDKRGDVYNWFENTLSSLVFDGTPFLAATIEEAITSLEIVVAAHVSDGLQGDPVEFPLGSSFDSQELRIA